MKGLVINYGEGLQNGKIAGPPHPSQDRVKLLALLNF